MAETSWAERLAEQPLRDVVSLTVLASASGVQAALSRSPSDSLLVLAGGLVGYAAISRVLQRITPSRVVPRQLPQSHRLFCGRDRELEELVAEHDRLRSRDVPEEAVAAQGPVVIRLSGLPGVGKSLLAHEYAREISAHYPDGQLYSNLGSAGWMRPPVTILKEFLEALGWRAAIPADALECAKVFRSLTVNRRLLVVLDAARTAEQVLQVMPVGEGCTVIVTSRRDLGSLSPREWSSNVGLPSFDAALTMLHAFTGRGAASDPLSAVELVELCGRLPVALRALGDIASAKQRSLADLALELRETDDQLAWLAGSGRQIEDRWAVEYERLTVEEQHALGMLSLVEADTFTPWVLIPLIGEKHSLDKLREAEAMVTRLAATRLIGSAGPDPALGVDRFTFHPLVKLFVRRRFDADEDAVRRARQRVAMVQLALADRVLAHIEPNLYRPMGIDEAHQTFPFGEQFYRGIAEHRAFWVRSEYLTLVSCVRLAYESGWHALSRKLAAFLRDPAPGQVDSDNLLHLLGRVAQRPEAGIGDPIGELDVQLAIGSVLLAFGWHHEARELLDSLTVHASELWPDPSIRQQARLREYEAYRRLGEVYLRAGAHADAERELLRAKEIARSVRDSGTDHRTEVIDAMLGAISRGQQPARSVRVLQEDDEDEWGFWARLALAEKSRPTAGAESPHLAAIERHYSGEGSRVAMALFRSARWHLRAGNRIDSVRHAARACVEYDKLGDRYGAVRALCLLSLALGAAGMNESAKEMLGEAEARFAKLDPLSRHKRSPLFGWLKRAHGALNSRKGHAALARENLRIAVEIFHDHGDRQCLRELEEYVDQYRLLYEPGIEQEPRRFEAWVEADGGIVVGSPLTACFAVGEAPRPRPTSLESQGTRYAGGLITVVVEAERARTAPRMRTVRLDPLLPLDKLRFVVTPTEAGELSVRFRVYAAKNGVLLQEFVVPSQPVSEPGGSLR